MTQLSEAGLKESCHIHEESNIFIMQTSIYNLIHFKYNMHSMNYAFKKPQLRLRGGGKEEEKKKRSRSARDSNAKRYKISLEE